MRYSLTIREVNNAAGTGSTYGLDRMENDNGLSLSTAKKYAEEWAHKNGFPCPVFTPSYTPAGFHKKYFARTHKSMIRGAEIHMDFTILEK